MKKIILVYLLSIVSSCHSQEKDKIGEKTKDKSKPYKIEIPINPKTMQTHTTEKFDIERYFKNRNETVGNYEYISSDGASIMETDIEGNTFFKSTTAKNSIFTFHKEYYKNGVLKTSWQTFKNDGFIKGKKYEYDEKGKLIKVEDYDLPFKYTWEQLKKYTEQELKIDLIKDEIGITNNYNDKSWNISFKGNYKNVWGIYDITLDGETGEVLKVIKIIGKEGEVEIIYEKK